MRFSGGAPKIAFLDIETDGLSLQSKILIVGILFYHGSCFQLYGDFCSKGPIGILLKDVELLVTFNGSSFDLPVLQRNFNLRFNQSKHLDLRFHLQKIGIKGGLKVIENNFGFKRSVYLKQEDLVVNFENYVHKGCIDSLKRVLKYNYEDLKAIELIFKYLNFMNRMSTL